MRAVVGAGVVFVVVEYEPDEIRHGLGVETGIEVVGHHGSITGDEADDGLARQDAIDSIGLTKGDGGGRFIDQDAGMDIAVGGFDFVDDILRRDLGAGIENAREELIRAGVTNSFEVGSDGITFVAQPMAGGAAIEKHGSTSCCVADKLQGGLEPFQPFVQVFASGHCQDGSGQVTNRGIAMIPEESRSRRIDMGARHSSGLDRAQQGDGTLRARGEDGQGFFADARGELRPATGQFRAEVKVRDPGEGSQNRELDGLRFGGAEQVPEKLDAFGVGEGSE